MKLNFLKASIFLSLIALTLSSCLKDDLQESKPIVEPEWWPYSVVWKETERKSGTADWEIISNGNPLVLKGQYKDTSKTALVGKYEYYSTNLGIDIDTVGGMQIEDSLLSFVAANPGGGLDTIAKVEYSNYGDTVLVIRNALVEPNIEIRYKVIDHYITPDYAGIGSMP